MKTEEEKREARLAYGKAWRAANLEKTRADDRARSKEPRRKEQARTHYAENIEVIRERDRQRYRADPAKKKAAASRYIEKHRKVVTERSRAYYTKNIETIRRKLKLYRRNNRDMIRRTVNEWRTNNPAKVVEYRQRRRARHVGASGSYRPSDWEALCYCYDNMCLCCGATHTPLTVDHIIPISQGGTNDLDNLQPLCQSCNSAKGVNTIDYRKW